MGPVLNNLMKRKTFKDPLKIRTSGLCTKIVFYHILSQSADSTLIFPNTSIHQQSLCLLGSFAELAWVELASGIGRTKLATSVCQDCSACLGKHSIQPLPCILSRSYSFARHHPGFPLATEDSQCNPSNVEQHTMVAFTQA